jgi:hypothetical protein
MVAICSAKRSKLVGEMAVRYFIHAMYFGGSDGLRLFKNRIGFRPFFVRWKVDSGSKSRAQLQFTIRPDMGV